MVRELLVDRSGDGMPDLFSDMLRNVPASGSSQQVIQTASGSTVVVHATTTTVTTGMDGNLHTALPEEVRRQVERALGKSPGAMSSGIGGGTASAARVQAMLSTGAETSRPRRVSMVLVITMLMVGLAALLWLAI
jgi:hypothetical protein